MHLTINSTNIDVNIWGTELGATRKEWLWPASEDLTVNDGRLLNFSPWQSRHSQTLGATVAILLWKKCTKNS